MKPLDASRLRYARSASVFLLALVAISLLRSSLSAIAYEALTMGIATLTRSRSIPRCASSRVICSAL